MEISHNSKGGINEVHQVFPIKEPDLKVLSCQRQRRFYSIISKPSILASTKGFTSQPGGPKYSTETLFNMRKLQIGWCSCHVKVEKGVYKTMLSQDMHYTGVYVPRLPASVTLLCWNCQWAVMTTLLLIQFIPHPCFINMHTKKSRPGTQTNINVSSNLTSSLPTWISNG